MAQHKPPPASASEIARQISAMPVAPSAEPQKREIVGKLNELAAQMKLWAVQVEGFASLINSCSLLPGQAPTQSQSQSQPDSAQYTARGTPNGRTYSPYPSPSLQQTQQYAGSQHYQFHVQQYQGHPSGASPPHYPLSAAAHSQPEASPPTLTTVLDGSEKTGKRRRKAEGTRRKKDPLAPKRPPSAYILYQNDVRKEMQEKYPGLTYSEVLGKISETWQTLDEEKKRVYLDMVERDKVRYEDEKLRYNLGQDIPTKPTPRRPLASLRAPSDPEIDPEPEGDEPEEDIDCADHDDQGPDPKRTRRELARANPPSNQDSPRHKPQPRLDAFAERDHPLDSSRDEHDLDSRSLNNGDTQPSRQSTPHSLLYPPGSPPQAPRSPHSAPAQTRSPRSTNGSP